MEESGALGAGGVTVIEADVHGDGGLREACWDACDVMLW